MEPPSGPIEQQMPAQVSAGRTYRGPFTVMTVLFFMWGFMTVFNDILIPSAGGIEDGHGFKRVTLPLEIPEVRRGDDVPIIGTFAEGFPHQHQPVRTGERQRLQ